MAAQNQRYSNHPEAKGPLSQRVLGERQGKENTSIGLETAESVKRGAGLVVQCLAEKGIKLPDAAPAAGNYVACQRNGNTITMSGQLPRKGTEFLVPLGHLGKNITIEQGQRAAEICALNLIGALNSACDGRLDQVTKVTHVNVKVASTPDFTAQATVANGASDLMVKVFGKEIGQHSRVAEGAASLPLGAPVEIAAVFQISDALAKYLDGKEKSLNLSKPDGSLLDAITTKNEQLTKARGVV